MDDLFNTLMQRVPQQANGFWNKPNPAGGRTSSSAPAPPPPGAPPPPPPQAPPPSPPAEMPALPQPHAEVPPKMQRFENAQAMQQGYRNGWSPNPMLLRAMLGRFR